MTHTAVLTASGAAKAGSGQLFTVQVTKPGTGASAITVFDNPSAGSGNILWQGDGLAEGSFDCSDGNGTGCVAATGLFVTLAGTTAPTVVIVYQ